jgi:hypothetical protein
LPSLRHREPTGMAVAQVVVVRITLSAEVIEPHLRPTVLVREGDHRMVGAAGS